MSIFSREYELMVIFRERNLIWEALYGDKYRMMDFYRDITCSQNYDKWKSHAEIGDHTANGIFDKTISLLKAKQKQAPDAEDRDELVKRVEMFREGFWMGDEDFNIRAAARTVGLLSIDRAYQLIDEQEYSVVPLFPSFIYQEEPTQVKNCKAAFRSYEGAYQTIFRRVITIEGEARTVYLQGALRVRYILEMPSWRAIRLKLNLPVIDARQHFKEFQTVAAHYQYGGWMNAREGDHIAFHFEFRTAPSTRDTRRDYMTITTGLKTMGADGIEQLYGKYMTMGQQTPREVVADDVVMRRVAKKGDDPILKCMRDVRVLRSAQEVSYAECLFAEAKKLKN